MSADPAIAAAAAVAAPDAVTAADSDSAAALAARYEAELNSSAAAESTRTANQPGYSGGVDFTQLYSLPSLESNETNSNPTGISSSASSHSSISCRACGESGHIAKNCPDSICKRCAKIGHATQFCPEANRIRLAEDENDTIYISGLPESVTQQQLMEHFGSIGLIRQVKGKGADRFKVSPKVVIYREKDSNAAKGDAVVSYEDPATAPAAVEWFNEKPFLNSTRIIKVQLAEKRSAEEFFPTQQNARENNFRNKPQQPAQAGDWICPSCGVSNFARRSECFKCKTRSNTGAANGGASDWNSNGKRGREDFGNRREPDRGGGNYRNSNYENRDRERERDRDSRPDRDYTRDNYNRSYSRPG